MPAALYIESFHELPPRLYPVSAWIVSIGSSDAPVVEHMHAPEWGVVHAPRIGLTRYMEQPYTIRQHAYDYAAPMGHDVASAYADYFVTLYPAWDDLSVNVSHSDVFPTFRAEWESPDAPPVPETASDLMSGDLVQYDKRNLWRILDVTRNDKTTEVTFVYVVATYAPQRVGTNGSWRFRNSTSLNITRKA